MAEQILDQVRDLFEGQIVGDLSWTQSPCRC
jgi:hypothetical protein